MFFHQNQQRCREGAPYQGAAQKNQPVNKVQEQGWVYHDILAPQVNICQLQVTLDMYFIIRTSGDIQIRKGMAMNHANVKILHNGVKSSAPTCIPLGQLGQHNFTIMHRVMQGTYIQLLRKSSLWPCNHSNVCMSGITYLHNILSGNL